MLLRNNLYTVTEAGSEYRVRFNASHPIFAGHFPGHPIDPGACLVQIAEELLSLHTGKNIQLQSIRNLKFRKAITPDMEVNFALTPHDENNYTIDIHDENNPYAQFSATYMCPNSDL